MTIITKKRVKELVRQTNKKEDVLRVDIIKKYFIHYDGEGKFEWFTLMNPPRGFRNLWIPMSAAFITQEDGSYLRRNLGELDELYYKAINESRVAKVYKTVRYFEVKRQAKLNQSLKYMNIGIQNNRENEEDYLYVFYRNELGSPKPDKEGYKELDGVGMGKRFEDFLLYRGYTLKGIENKSEELGMYIRISCNYIDFWNSLIEATKEFDKYLRFE